MTYARKFEDFSSQVFQHGSNIDGSLGTNAHLVLRVLLQETLDTTARELQKVKVSMAHHTGRKLQKAKIMRRICNLVVRAANRRSKTPSEVACGAKAKEGCTGQRVHIEPKQCRRLGAMFLGTGKIACDRLCRAVRSRCS